ncbi:MAG: hypothetical protein ACI30I_08865 [Parabacteroides sp.]
MIQEPQKYEEWLTTIANTRFIFNTLEELEEMLSNHAIHSNGIKRSFPTLQKLRSAYRDLKVEVELMTDGFFQLDQVMFHYQRAWIFYRDKLYRRKNPRQVALDLLIYCYPTAGQEPLCTRNTAIYEEIREQQIHVPFLILFLLKVLPGYDSKGGDVTNIDRQYEQVMQLLDQFTNKGKLFTWLPAIAKARQEPRKTRLMLLFHLSLILHAYTAYNTTQTNLYDIADNLKTQRVQLDIAGYWNECGGRLLNTQFWQIEAAAEEGTYFMTHWHKDAENRLTGVRYTLFIMEGTDGGLIYYLIHPLSIEHRMQGLAYSDIDHTWYRTDPLPADPVEMLLQRVLPSQEWPNSIPLSRCTDEAVVSQYRRWMEQECRIVKPYGHLEYEFHYSLYAITTTHLFIASETAGEYYKVPKSAYEGFECIQLDDAVGLMRMNGQVYLVFDEFLLYISTEESQLSNYQIERVHHID